MKPLVAVKWLDAHGSSTIAYAEHEIPHAAIVVITEGRLLRDDEAGITLANERCADHTWRGVTFIPSGMIVSVSAPEHATRPRKPKPNANPPS
jgi:hypothetical protein